MIVRRTMCGAANARAGIVSVTKICHCKIRCFFVAKICKRALRASTEGYLAVVASTPTYGSLVVVIILILSKYQNTLFSRHRRHNYHYHVAIIWVILARIHKKNPLNLPYNCHLFIIIQVVIIILPNNTIGNQDWSIMQLWPKYYANIFRIES